MNKSSSEKNLQMLEYAKLFSKPERTKEDDARLKELENSLTMTGETIMREMTQYAISRINK